jgi:histidyl-tRNA synthetase
LLSKGATDNEIYLLRRLHAGADGSDDEIGRRLGLHFDLTVPLARYVLENAGHLHFPFRRYQIQKAWRGERPQEGRYREFTQADIDVIGKDTLPFHPEVEMAQVMAVAFQRLPLPALRMQVNNRKLIEGYYLGLGVENIPPVMRVVDKLDKIGHKGVHAALLAETALTADQAAGCLELASITSDEPGFADRVQKLGVTHPLLDAGLDELSRVLDGTADLESERFSIVADLRIARGLDYYTGTVYETRMSGFEGLGSVCSGGRYDALATDGRTTYPGVGISVGVSRLLGPLLSRGLLSASRSTPTCVLVALVSEGRRGACEQTANVLRRRGIASEVAPEATKYGKQIRYAERRGIPFVWFPGDGDGTEPSGHQVRDIRSGEQADGDPSSWEPPAEDLRPAITGPRSIS